MTLPLLCITAMAQESANKVRPNYELAERFSPTKISRMVKQTTVRNTIWLANGKEFIYSWSDSNGTKFYLVDAVRGTRKELWDMDWLAQEVTLRTGDPYDAQHLPVRLNRIIRDNRYVRFDIGSKKEVKRVLPRHERNDSAKIAANKGK